MRACSLFLIVLVLTGCNRRPRTPDAQVEDPASLSVSVDPAALKVESGLSARVKVNVNRKNCNGDTRIELTNLPKGLTATPVNAGSENSAEIEINAAPGTAPGEKSGIVASASAGETAGKSSAFGVSVLKPSFTCVSEPSTIRIPKGQTRQVKLTVQRVKDAYQGPVTLTLANLPKNITATAKETGPEGAWATFTLQAGADAAEGEVNGHVKIEGGRQLRGVALLPVTVLGAPFVLKAEPTSVAGVFGQSTKVKLSATRKDYQGPIAIRFENLPGSVRAKPLTLPAKETTGEVELNVSPDALSDDKEIQVRGATDDQRDATTKFTLAIEGKPFVLQVQPVRVDVVQGSSAKVKVVAVRSKDFKGPIHLELRNLPKTFGVLPATINAGAKETELEISASDDAPRGPSGAFALTGVVKVGGETREVKYDKLAVNVLSPFNLVVQPGRIELMEGEKKTVKVQVERRTYKGAIAVELKNLPAGVSAAEAQIPRDKDSIDVEITAGPGSGGKVKADVQALGSPANKRSIASNNVTVAVISKLFELKVDKSAKLTMGSKSALRVTAQRQDYEGPIALEIKNLPADVKGLKAEIPAGKNEVDIEMIAANQVKDTKATIQILGIATAKGKQERLSSNIALEIVPGFFDLKIEPILLKLHHGGSAKVMVSALRKGYDGPITVELKNLPAKTSAEKITIAKGESSAEVEVKAMLTVLDGAKVDVFARASASGKTVDSSRFTVNVWSEGQPIPLELKIEPASIKLAAGGTTKVKVLAARKGYKGPITVDLRNLPAEVESSKGMIAEGDNDVEITLTAKTKAEVAVRGDVAAVGIAVGADNRAFASPQVSLEIGRKQ